MDQRSYSVNGCMDLVGLHSALHFVGGGRVLFRSMDLPPYAQVCLPLWANLAVATANPALSKRWNLPLLVPFSAAPLGT